MVGKAPFVVTYVVSTGTANGVFFLTAALSIVESDDFVGLALQGLAQATPALALAALIGTLRRRLSFRALLPGLMWVEAITCAAFGMYSLFYGYSLPFALVLGFVVGITSNAQAPGRQSLMADLVDRETRRRALSSISTAGNVSRLVAPALAGFALAANIWWGWFLLHAAVLVVAGFAATSAVRAVGAAPPARLDAASNTRRVSMLRIIVPFGILCTFGFNIQILAPVITEVKLADLLALTGIVVTVHALGTVVGTFLVGRLNASLALVFGVGSAILGVGLAAIPFLNEAIVILLVVFGAGIGRGAALNASSVMSTTFTEDVSAREHLVAFIAITFSGSNVVSFPLVAFLLTVGGLPLAMVACGVGCVVAAAVWWLWGSRWWEGRDEVATA